MKLLLLALMAVCSCDAFRSEGYRRVEFSSLADSQLTLVCGIGAHSDWFEYEQSTPWTLELDLDTIRSCLCGTHCMVWKASSGREGLRVRTFSRHGLLVDTSTGAPGDPHLWPVKRRLARPGLGTALSTGSDSGSRDSCDLRTRP